MDQSVQQKLAEPFDPNVIHWKPQVVKGNQCYAVPYLDPRDVMDRLDSVVGVGGWQDQYEILPGGSVVCQLRILLGDTWITKTDVGSPSAQPDAGDKLKAAFSDALKRAAIKWGIGRYLYRVGGQWVAYDPQRRRMTGTPKPPAALPAVSTREPAGHPAKPPAPAANGVPATGLELHKRLVAFEDRMVKIGLCQHNELMEHIKEAGAQRGNRKPIDQWPTPEITQAVEDARAFEAVCQRRAKESKEPAAVERVHPDEYRQLAALVAGDTTRLERILEDYQISKLEDLPRLHFAGVKGWLERTAGATR